LDDKQPVGNPTSDREILRVSKMTHFAIFNVFDSYKSVAMKFGTASRYHWLISACIISRLTLVMFLHYLRIH